MTKRLERRPTSDPEMREKMFHLLGTMNDKQVAKIIGVHPSAINYHRRNYGIPACKNHKRRWTDENVQKFINYYVDHTKQECAEKFGFTLSYVQCLLTIFRKRGFYVPYELQ